MEIAREHGRPRPQPRGTRARAQRGAPHVHRCGRRRRAALRFASPQLLCRPVPPRLHASSPTANSSAASASHLNPNLFCCFILLIPPPHHVRSATPPPDHGRPRGPRRLRAARRVQLQPGLLHQLLELGPLDVQEGLLEDGALVRRMPKLACNPGAGAAAHEEGCGAPPGAAGGGSCGAAAAAPVLPPPVHSPRPSRGSSCRLTAFAAVVDHACTKRVRVFNTGPSFKQKKSSVSNPLLTCVPWHRRRALQPRKQCSHEVVRSFTAQRPTSNDGGPARLPQVGMSEITQAKVLLALIDCRCNNGGATAASGAAAGGAAARGGASSPPARREQNDGSGCCLGRRRR